MLNKKNHNDMKTQHTKGKWSLAKSYTDEDQGGRLVADGKWIVTSYLKEWKDRKQGEGAEELICSEVKDAANARLIAAAPELLEALQGSAQLLVTHGVCDTDSPTLRPILEAIQKATS